MDGLFKGAAFCKHICPIGQFNFAQSLVSPLEIGVRDPVVCATCETKDCIRGRDGIPGCELELFQPVKQGNMDCTFCLDCVHAVRYPHGNIGVLAGLPHQRLSVDQPRSDGSRLARRPDIAALAVLLVFAAFANAAGMVGPVLDWEYEVQQKLGLTSSLPLIIGLSVTAAPPCCLLLQWELPTWTSRSGTGGLILSTFNVAVRFSASLVPLGVRDVARPLRLPFCDRVRLEAWPVIQRFFAGSWLEV